MTNKAKQNYEDIPDEFLTGKEVAKRLRRSEKSIELDSNMPRLKIGRSVRYEWPEVYYYIKSLNGFFEKQN